MIESDWQLNYPLSFDLGYLPIWGGHARSDSARQAIAQKLKKVRSTIGVATDRKRLVSYNGLMLSTISQQMKQRPDLSVAGQKLAQFIGQAWQAGALSQGFFGHKTLSEADLEGYAFAAKGLLDYAIATGDVDASDLAIALLKRSEALFVQGEGFIAQAAIEGFTLPRQLAFSDTALTAATGVWIDACLASREPTLVKSAQQQLRKALPLMQTSPLDYASLWTLYWQWYPF